MKRSSGQAVHAVAAGGALLHVHHRAGRGRSCGWRRRCRRRRSPRSPTQPQAQPFPPPPTATAAAQLSMPRYSALRGATSLPAGAEQPGHALVGLPGVHAQVGGHLLARVGAHHRAARGRRPRPRTAPRRKPGSRRSRRRRSWRPGSMPATSSMRGSSQTFSLRLATAIRHPEGEADPAQDRHRRSRTAVTSIVRYPSPRLRPGRAGPPAAAARRPARRPAAAAVTVALRTVGDAALAATLGQLPAAPQLPPAPRACVEGRWAPRRRPSLLLGEPVTTCSRSRRVRPAARVVDEAGGPLGHQGRDGGPRERGEALQLGRVVGLQHQRRPG